MVEKDGMGMVEERRRSGEPGLRPRLILASCSPARRALLERAGIPFTIEPSAVDEDEVRERAAGLSPEELAHELARAKALDVCSRLPTRPAGTIVVGADQVLEIDGRILTKPEDLDAARRQLLELRGRCHRLLSAAVAVGVEGETVWTRKSQAKIKMRNFSPCFLDQYIASAGEDILETVGCYKIEGLGIQLMEDIDGDWFTILGLPLLELLAFLRDEGILKA